MSREKRPYTTILGRVVYDRPKHGFTDKDILRILKARMDDEIDDLPAYFAALAAAELRLLFAVAKKTWEEGDFVKAFFKLFFPQMIATVIEYYKDAYEILSAGWNLAIGILRAVATKPED